MSSIICVQLLSLNSPLASFASILISGKLSFQELQDKKKKGGVVKIYNFEDPGI